MKQKRVIHYDVKDKRWQISCNAYRSKRGKNQTHIPEEVTCKWCLKLLLCSECKKPRWFDIYVGAWLHRNNQCKYGFKDFVS